MSHGIAAYKWYQNEASCKYKLVDANRVYISSYIRNARVRLETWFWKVNVPYQWVAQLPGMWFNMQNLRVFLITPRAHNEHVKVDRRRAAMTMEDFMCIFSKTVMYLPWECFEFSIKAWSCILLFYFSKFILCFSLCPISCNVWQIIWALMIRNTNGPHPACCCFSLDVVQKLG